jgi:hypothetical protein
MIRILLHFAAVIVLTVFTQLGGIAWVIALMFRRRVLAFFLLYATLSVSAVFIAPIFGRVPLPCFSSGPLQSQSLMYCALNRHYVTPQLHGVLTDFAVQMEQTIAGTVTQTLDANFPFFTGVPLLPHLSHDDGEKVDIAFYYRGSRSGVTRSPIGYFAFEDGPTDCPKDRLTLRWNMSWLQGLWRDLELDDGRMSAALFLLSGDSRVSKIFIEPHLKKQLNISGDKVRFQGCRAARHDDHIHIQL